jgi:hypothetical protein
MGKLWCISPEERRIVTQNWIESVKRILIRTQLRDNLEKTVVVRDYDDIETPILIKLKSSCDFEEGSFA